MIFFCFSTTLIASVFLTFGTFNSVVFWSFDDDLLTIGTFTDIYRLIKCFTIKESLNVSVINLIFVLSHVFIPQITHDPFLLIILLEMRISFLRDVLTTFPTKISTTFACHFIASVKLWHSSRAFRTSFGVFI